MDDAKTPPQPEYAPLGTPVAFCDGVLNFWHSPTVVKFYLGRLDPSTNAIGPSMINVVGQVIMPVAGFVQMVAFFEDALNMLVEQNIVSKEQIEVARRGGAE